MFNPASGSGVQQIFPETWEEDVMTMDEIAVFCNENVFLGQTFLEYYFLFFFYFINVIYSLQAVTNF